MEALPPLDTTVLMHRCSKCGIGSAFKHDIEKHVASSRWCQGAALVSAHYVVNQLAPPPSTGARRKRQSAAAGEGVHAHTSGAPVVVNYGDHSTTIGTLIVIMAAPDDDGT